MSHSGSSLDGWRTIKFYEMKHFIVEVATDKELETHGIERSDYKHHELDDAFGSISDNVKKYFEDACMFHIQDDGIYFHPVWLHSAQSLINTIADEYGASDCRFIWTAFDLGGDDDVDYNSSYVDSGLSYVRCWCDHYRINWR